jgi:hypothetical protein
MKMKINIKNKWLISFLARRTIWLRYVSFKDIDLSRVDFRGENLYAVNFQGADFSRANLSGADLRYANLEGANLREANLEGANLSWAYFSGTNLEGANLEGANLSGVDLSGVDFWRVQGISVTQEKGSKDLLVFIKYGKNLEKKQLQIGCLIHPLEFWLKNYKKIGLGYRYSKKEIQEYLLYIQIFSEVKFI